MAAPSAPIRIPRAEDTRRAVSGGVADASFYVGSPQRFPPFFPAFCASLPRSLDESDTVGPMSAG